jgi:steroid 5-alpha reductase family enzyme
MTNQLDVVLIAGGVALACFFAAWAWGMSHDGDASTTDAFYGFAPLTQGAVVYALWDEHSARGTVVLALACLWSTGLGLLLVSRVRANHNFGGDPRFVMALQKYNPGKHLWWITLLILVVGQAAFVTVLNLPMMLAITHAYDSFTVIDVIGFAVVATGATFEVLGNHQLERFRHDPAHKGKGHTLNTGLWKYSRHPNFFGETLCFFGFFVIAMRDPELWYTVAGPLVIFGVLRFGSGVKLTEFMMLQKRKDDPIYLDYLARTSPFLPRPPRRPAASAPTPTAASERSSA